VVEETGAVNPQILSFANTQSILPVAMAVLATAGVLLAKRQAKTAADKLRWDQHERKIEAHRNAHAFYIALVSWDASEESKSIHTAFVKAVLESRLVFKPESGISNILEEMSAQGQKVIGLKEHGKELVNCPDAFVKMFSDAEAALAWFPSALDKLEKKIGYA
jgi:hypothetical protein